MPTVHKKFRLETEPIETMVDDDGHKTTSFASLNFRVLDAATDVPIGLILHVRDGDGMKYEAIPLYGTSPGKPVLPPNGDWGQDVHGAGVCLWHDWNKTLGCWPRFWRSVARWLDLYWLILGVVLGSLASMTLQSTDTKEADGAKADHRPDGESRLHQTRGHRRAASR